MLLFDIELISAKFLYNSYEIPIVFNWLLAASSGKPPEGL
jgi:hypothetical protein